MLFHSKNHYMTFTMARSSINKKFPHNSKDLQSDK
jgi:hypothetical protein